MSRMQRIYLASALMVIGSDQVVSGILEPNPAMSLVKWIAIFLTLLLFVIVKD